MKVTKNDITMQSLFVDKADTYGFGTTQSKAKLSNKQIQRLLDLKLIKVCRQVNCVGIADHNGFVRSGTHYCKT